MFEGMIFGIFSQYLLFKCYSFIVILRSRFDQYYDVCLPLDSWAALGLGFHPGASRPGDSLARCKNPSWGVTWRPETGI